MSDDGDIYPRQDGRFGRDAAIAAGVLSKTGKGAAGFDYTKVCNNGLREGEGDCKAAAQNVPGTGTDDWGCTRDNVTGLLWKVLLESPTDWYQAAAADYPPAVAAGNGRLCGSDGWRLPDRRELISLVHGGSSKAPYIDTAYFPGTPESDVPALFWSSRTFYADAAWSWYVYFGFGGSGLRNKADTLSVRLVSGPGTQAQFVAGGDGTVLDSATGLTWDRCTLGQSGNDCGGLPFYKTWWEALDAVVEANWNNYKGYNDWRLPNKNELESLVDLDRVAPAINTEFFPQTPDAYFWSGTPSAAFGPGSVWSVLFSLGGVGIEPQEGSYLLRLVRGGNAYASFDRAGVNRSKLDVFGIAHDSATLSIEIDRDTAGAFLVLPASMPMPTAERIRALGQNHVFVANVPQRFRLDGLFPGSDYRVWFVAKTGGNFSGIAQMRFATRDDDTNGRMSCAVDEGTTLGTGCVNRIAAGATPSFCLPASGAAMLDIEGVRYTLTARTKDTCFEIVAIDGNLRAPLLRRGAAVISAVFPDTALLVARSGDIVRADGNGSSISAQMDPLCTSTRIGIEAGKVSAPAWMTASHAGSDCPADALTPPRAHYALNDGALDCPAAALSIRGIYRALSLTETLNLKANQQVFYVAYVPAAAGNAGMWFQATRDRGWTPFDGLFDPFDIVADSGTRELSILSRLDVQGLPANTELYLGYGDDAGEMVTNKRYCGVLTLAK